MKMLDKLKNYAKYYENEVRDISNKLRDEMMPELSRELFDEYEITGNRLRYEAVYFKRREFLSAFGLASIIWHKKEDIQKLEYVIGEICSEGCWALSAHVKRLEDPNWRKCRRSEDPSPPVWRQCRRRDFSAQAIRRAPSFLKYADGTAVSTSARPTLG